MVTVCYMYFIFRKNVHQPLTFDQLTQQLLPGLSELTKTQNTIVLWFYSLSKKRYVQYTLDNDLKFTLNENENTHRRVGNLANGFYFNFSLQRWEKVNFLDRAPYINNKHNTIEQRIQTCHTSQLDGGGDIICEETVKKASIRTKVGNEIYSWDEGNKILFQNVHSSFPQSKDVNVCMFTSNRYKEYLRISFRSTLEENDGDKEQRIDVYFARKDNGWILNECSGSTNQKTVFNGVKCVIDTTTDQTTEKTKNGFKAYNEVFNTKLLHSDLVNDNIKTIKSYYLHLNAIYSKHINMNIKDKIYLLDINFYKSCSSTIFIVGKRKTNIDTNFIENDGNMYDWRLEQVINNTTSSALLKEKQQFLPVLEQPFKLFLTRNGELTTVEKRFVIYKNNIYYSYDYLVKLQDVLSGLLNYEIDTDHYENVHNSNSIVSNSFLIPHLRKYEIENSHGTLCNLYATFAGNCILDVYGETRLLIDYIENIHRYSFFQRNDDYPVIDDDFQIETWSCAQNVDNPKMYTYIALVDMFENLAKHATSLRKLI